MVPNVPVGRFELAADLAKTHGAKLIILHVWQAGPVPDDLRHMARVEHFAERKQPVGAGASLSRAPLAAPPTDPAADWRILELVGEKSVARSEVARPRRAARRQLKHNSSKASPWRRSCTR